MPNLSSSVAQRLLATPELAVLEDAISASGHNGTATGWAVELTSDSGNPSEEIITG
jgi:hypothetical protein